MSNIVPKEVFLLYQSKRVTEHAIIELKVMVGALREACRDLVKGWERLSDQIAESEAKARLSKERFDALNQQYHAALDSPTLEELILARDAYATSLVQSRFLEQQQKPNH